MTATDSILDQIDRTLDDHTVSADAMRHAPDLPRPSAVHPRANGANAITQRLIDRHSLSAKEARAAVLAAERGHDSTHARLAVAEAHAIAEEMRAQLQPMFQRAIDQLRQIGAAFGHMSEAIGCDDCHKPPRPRDRPAWQSPYGPRARRP